MPLPDRAAFAAACRRADAETLAGFAAALYEARGDTVTDTGGTSFTVERDGRRERVAVAGTDEQGADVLIAADPPADAAAPRVVDAAQLREWLRYAVDPETAERLVEAWFDGLAAGSDDERQADTDDGSAATVPPLDGRSEPVGTPSRDADSGRTRTASSGPSWQQVSLAVGLLVLVVGTVGLLLAAPFAPGDGPVAADIGGASPTATPVESIPAAATATATPAAASVNASALPPGVDASGITDYRRLVAAHEAGLGNRSFRATLVYHEFVDGEAVGVVVQTVRVASPTEYHASRTAMGDVETTPPNLVRHDAYANGTTRTERVAGTGRPVSDEDRYRDRLRRYLGWYLSVEQSWVANQTTVGDTTLTRVQSDGDSWPGVEDATGSAVVTERGVVRLARRSYRDADTGRRVVVTVRVSDVGTTTVVPPAWVRDG